MIKINLTKSTSVGSDDARSLRLRGLFALLNGLVLVGIVQFDLTATAATLLKNSPVPTQVRSEFKTEIEKSVNESIKEFTLDPQAAPEFDRESILSDYEDRVTDLFEISPALKNRVGFWFDIYTKYPSEEQVIHHREYPWIVFKVIDTSPIIYAETPKRRWQRNLKAQALVKQEMAKLRKQLLKLSRINLRKAKLSAEEQDLVEKLKKLSGNFSKNARFAAANVRVQTGQKDFFEKGLVISAPYMPEMDRIFTEHRIPPELTRLPLVESSFNHLATSKAGASGVWQFVGNTGKKFLIINKSIDERRSPLKSTHAAARLLKENHMILFREWPLAITAYNHGPAGIRKATRVVGSRDIAKIVSRYRSRTFGFAGVNYYAEFLAALYAEKYKDEIFSFASEPNYFTQAHIIIPRAMRTSNVLKLTGLTEEEVLLYNPDLKQALKKGTTLPRGYRLHVPDDRKEDLRAKLAAGKKSIGSRG